MGGVNDLGDVGGSATTLFSRLTQLVGDRREKGWFPIIVCTIVGAVSTLVTDYNNLIKSNKHLFDGVADPASNLQLQNLADNTVYQDGVHPTALGHSLIAPYVATAFNTATGL